MNHQPLRQDHHSVGTTNLHGSLTTTYLNGTQSYDDLYVGCGITSCGSIIATGDLTLNVNTLTVQNGASIIAYDQPINTQGFGGSSQMSASYIGDGGGGAGHKSSGGAGGSSSGTTTNGGAAFGVGNETGSNGGSVTDSNGNTISAGGIGGGRIVINADVIEIYGTVDASGQDGEQGYRYQNGSGNGGSGAGAGSGGSIIMRANQLTVGAQQSGGSILAQGGDGGDGADGFCAPGSACLFMYHGGQGGGGGSGGTIDIRANSAANLSISSAATISATGGSAGSGGAPYGTGSPGVAGSNGGNGNTTNGLWTGWSSSNPPTPPATSIPNPCIGGGTNAAGIIVADSLEVNDAQATASPASILPVSCTDLSLHTSTDSDYFEIQMVTGVTYYVNLTFSHAIQDVDAEWNDVNGSILTSAVSTTDNESLSVTATQNVTSYVRVYPFSFGTGGTNPISYDINIETDNPGGGQSLELAYVNILNSTNASVSFAGLQSNTTYDYTTVLTQDMIGNTSVSYSLGNGTFNSSNSSTYSFGVNYTLENNQSLLEIVTLLYDANGNLIATGFDDFEIDLMELEATSSTTGEINLTNLSIGTNYDLVWMVYDYTNFSNAYQANNSVYDALNVSVIDENTTTFSALSDTRDFNVTWAGPTTTNFHVFVAVLSLNGTDINLENNENFSAFEDDFFIPSLPSIVISSVSSSVNSSTNDVTTRGLDLVVGDTYSYRIKILDSGNATVAQSALTTVTATYQGMSFGTWSYTTPTTSGQYCALAELYEADGTQRIGDTSCFTLTFDSDYDGVANEIDQCPSSPAGAIVDQFGCAASQRDTDNDGVNDDMDDFVNDSSQWSDQDGDGYGDNPNGNNSDDFPSDGTQWSDQDGDGYGDNQNGTFPDAFPTDSTQWSDMDGDGYGDNPNGNNADLWTNDSSQWFDSDSDGYGDNPTGTNGDAFPTDGTQWSDQDGDGFGDNQTGNNPGRVPNRCYAMV